MSPRTGTASLSSIRPRDPAARRSFRREPKGEEKGRKERTTSGEPLSGAHRKHGSETVLRPRSPCTSRSGGRGPSEGQWGRRGGRGRERLRAQPSSVARLRPREGLTQQGPLLSVCAPTLRRTALTPGSRPGAAETPARERAARGGGTRGGRCGRVAAGAARARWAWVCARDSQRQRRGRHSMRRSNRASQVGSSPRRAVSLAFGLSTETSRSFPHILQVMPGNHVPTEHANNSNKL